MQSAKETGGAVSSGGVALWRNSQRKCRCNEISPLPKHTLAFGLGPFKYPPHMAFPDHLLKMTRLLYLKGL